MITPKNAERSPSAEMAHMNDLLHEALSETFPASDPIAINIELQSAGDGIATTHHPSRSARRPTAPWTR
jgi:hypothetical protein